MMISLTACRNEVTLKDLNLINSEMITLQDLLSEAIDEINKLRTELDEVKINLDLLRTVNAEIETEAADDENFIMLGSIKWRILEIQDDKALVISEHVLFSRAMYETQSQGTWSSSTLRRHLNGQFYNNTFSEEEKERILETTISEPVYGGDRLTHIDIVDKVFLLSMREVSRYFNNASSRIATRAAGSRSAAWWWLRDPGFMMNFARVTVEGNFDTEGMSSRNESGGVRPAMWIRLE